MPGRAFVGSNDYRYGFNGKENDNEVKGQGNQQDYGMRIYDPRLGRFLSVDPLTKQYPMLTPYAFAENDVIRCIDLDGLEKVKVIDKRDFGLRMVMWVLNSTQVWRQFQKDIMNPAINPEKMDVYITKGDVRGQQGVIIPTEIDKDGNYTSGEQNGETQDITYGNALKYGVWDFEEGKKGVVLILNTSIVNFIAKNLFSNTKAAINVMKKAALTLYHEATAHGLDEMLGNKTTTKEDHQKFYGKDVVLNGDFSPSYEEIDINGTSPASKAKKEIDKAGTTIKEKIELIKKK